MGRHLGSGLGVFFLRLLPSFWYLLCNHILMTSHVSRIGTRCYLVSPVTVASWNLSSPDVSLYPYSSLSTFQYSLNRQPRPSPSQNRPPTASFSSRAPYPQPAFRCWQCETCRRRRGDRSRFVGSYSHLGPSHPGNHCRLRGGGWQCWLVCSVLCGRGRQLQRRGLNPMFLRSCRMELRLFDIH